MSTITQSAVEEIIDTKLKPVKHAIKDLRLRVESLEWNDLDGEIQEVKNDLESLDGFVMELTQKVSDLS